MSLQSVNLTEWETRRPTKGSPLAGPVLANDPAARRLAEALTCDRRIEILELASGLELRAASFVGRFVLGPLEVTIRPKIAGVPLMNLLRYAYRLRNLQLFDQTGHATSQVGFQDLLIHQLAAEASELFSRGLHRDYRRTETVLANPRGRINFGDYVRVAANAVVGLPCIDHPRSEDTPLNQVLHGGLELAARMTTDRELGWRVRRLAKRLALGISPRPLDSTALAEAWHSLDRRTNAYRPALTLIGILLQTEGAALADAAARIQAAGFLFDMNRFFQALVSRFLGENLDGFEVQDERVLRGVFQYDPSHNPRSRRAPTLRPDFLVMHRRKVAAVLDAKYRDLWDKNLPREMLYQLALYALGQPAGERRATIIYPTLENAARDQMIRVMDPLRGSPAAEVTLRPLNLLRLDQLLREKSPHARRRRAEYARSLVFGTPP